MDILLHRKFEKNRFDDNTTNLFATLVQQDEQLKQLLLFIVHKSQNKEKVSIAMLMEELVVERRVGVKQNKAMKFEKKEALIERKAAEKLIEKLSSMTLIYYEDVKPYKFYSLTVRGIQVAKLIQSKKNNIEGSNQI